MGWAAACGAMATAFILSSCGGSSSGSPAVSSVPSTSTTDLRSKTLPNSPAGTQLRWFLGSVADAPLSQQEIDSHFDGFFLDKVSAAKINTALAELPAPGTLVGVLSSEPTGLVVIANFGTARWKVTLSVDGSGLIDGLLLAPLRLQRVGLRSTRPWLHCSQRQLSCRTSSQRVLSADPPAGVVDATTLGI